MYMNILLAEIEQIHSAKSQRVLKMNIDTNNTLAESRINKYN